MDDLRSPEAHRPRQRGAARTSTRTRWNYKRIAVAIAALIVLSSSAAYGGYSVAHRLSAAGDAKVAKKPVKITSTSYRPPATTTTTEPEHYVKHTVKQGDSYYAIALKYQTSVDEIKKLNHIDPDNNDLQIGMVLKVPVKEATAIEGEESQAANEEDTGTEQSYLEVSSKELFKGPSEKKRVALTFDAGASSEATPRILEALKDAGVKGTFFLTGRWIEEHPELAKQIAQEGHIIGNHTYSHVDLTKETDNEIVYQLSKTETIVKAETGASSKPIFRPPYGARDGRVLRVASGAGYRSIYWTIDSLDWKPSMKPGQVKNRVLAGLTNGAIVLMHCGSSQTAEVLPELINELKSRGYEVVSIAELFK